MASILPGLVDRQRRKPGRSKGFYWVGQVLMFGAPGGKRVIAEVYADTLEECRARKRAVCKALQEELKKGTT